MVEQMAARWPRTVAMTHRIIRPANSPRQKSIVQASRWVRCVKKPAEL